MPSHPATVWLSLGPLWRVLSHLCWECFSDVEAFAKAMQNSARPEQEGDAKDKKDDEEDMSLD